MSIEFGTPADAERFQRKMLAAAQQSSMEIEVSKSELLTLISDATGQALRELFKPQRVKGNQTAIANPIRENQEKLRKQALDLEKELNEVNQKNADVISKLESLLRRPFQMRGANMGYVILQNKLARALRELRNEFPS